MDVTNRLADPESGRRGLARALLAACLLILASASSFANEVYVKSVLADNTELWGVVVRRTGTYFVIATADSSQVELTRSRVNVLGAMSPAAQRANTALDYIDGYIRKRQFDLIGEDLKRLDVALAAFREEVQYTLASQAEPAAKKQAIRHAIAYWERQRTMIQPTIAALELAKEIEALASQDQLGRMPSTPATLEMLAGRLRQLASLPKIEDTPLATKERTDSRNALERMLNRHASALTRDAAAAFANEFAFEVVAERLRLFATMVDVHPAMVEPQRELLTGVSATITARIEQLLTVTRQTLSLTADGIAVNRERQSRLATLISGSLVPGLAELRQLTFGEPAAELSRGLGELQDRCQALLGEAKVTLDLILQAQAAYGRGVEMQDAGQFALAVESFAETRERLAQAGLAESAAALSAGNRELICRARYRRQQLAAVTHLETAEIDRLLEECRVFIEDNRAALLEQKIDLRGFEREIQFATDYRAYRLMFARLKEYQRDDPEKAWQAMLELSDWLAVRKGISTTMAAAYHEWEAYRRANEEAIFSRASDAVLTAENIDLKDKQDLFLTFPKRYIEMGEYGQAIKIIDRALAQLDRGQMSAAERQRADLFIGKLLEQKLLIADREYDDGKLAASVALYGALREEYPAFAASQHLDQRYAEALLAIAMGLETEGKVDEAIARYESLARDFPAMAAKHRLLDRLIGLATAGLPESDDPLASPEVLAVYERYAAQEAFADFVKAMPFTNRLRSVLSERFSQAWPQGKPRQALELYVQISQMYPKLSQAMELNRQLLITARNNLDELVRQAKGSNVSGAAAATVPTNILEAAAELLAMPDVQDLTQHAVTQLLYVRLLLQRADNFLQVSQVTKAFEIYRQIIEDYPQIAKSENVQQTMDDKAWELKMERFRQPLRIRGALDWVALVAWLLIWPAFFFLARRRGKRRGDLTYRMHHFISAFGVFLLFLLVLLFFDCGHATAFTVAFILPGLFFHGIGGSTYWFFPLIYYERRLFLERGLRWVLHDSPIGAVAPAELRLRLESHLRDLESMVDLMSDRERFEVHVAIRLSQRDAEKGTARLKRLLERLESRKSRDESWVERHAMVVHRLGLMAHGQGRIDDARRYLEAYLEHRPKDIEARQMLGDLEYDTGRYEEAIPHLKVSLAAAGQDESLWYKLGRSFFETEKYVASYKCFEAAKNKSRDILFWGARAFGRANERERASRWYQALLKRYPNDTEAVYYLACVFAEMGQHVKALKVATVIKEQDPFYPSALTLQGNILFKKDEVQKAEEFYTKALALSPTFVPALLGKGQMELAAGRRDEARKLIEAVLSQQPAHPAANYFLGIILEPSDAKQAVEHLKRAAEAPDFVRWAARRIGYLCFFNQDLDTALTYFERAEEAGESSPWFLFIYAYALASKRQLRRCEQILIKILGRTGQSRDWSAETATRAMYAIGIMLFQHHAYRMAHQCFEFVRENPLPGVEMASVNRFIDEARFRMVANWLEHGEYLEAQARCAELQLEAPDQARFRTCQYYLSLCQLFQAQYEEAATLLASLVQSEPNNARYRYHQIIAELGRGNENEARTAMNAFAGMNDRPPHLVAGLVTIQAYLSARRGKVEEAEKMLARVSLPADDAPGARYLREKIILARIYYLCHLQDYGTIAALSADLAEEQKAKALYLQAISALQNNDYGRALEFLRPFADRSPRDRQLYTYLVAQQAIRVLQEGRAADAKEYLRHIAKPPKEIQAILTAWNASDDLAAARDPESLTRLIDSLQQYHGQMEDEYLNYFILHNLAVLYLKRAFVVENQGEESAKLDTWSAAIQFWHQQVFAKPAHWNLAQARFQEPGKGLRPFTSEEIEAINQACKDQYFVNVFIGLVLYYLAAGNEAGTDRHMRLLRMVADLDDKLKVYYRRLGEKVEKYLRSVDKGSPLWNNWDFTVASLEIQVRIADVLGLDHSAAKEQLELYQQTRRQFESPAAYQKAKRHFNTILLEAIQVGVRGSFSEAGEMIDKVLGDIPPGIELGKVTDTLKLLREACRNPAAYAERGVNLSQQFEKAYAAVRNLNAQKGKADAGTRKS